MKNWFNLCRNGNQRVFFDPYIHQVEALRHGRVQSIVSTGTGSGKTECFLWPIVDIYIIMLETKITGITGIRPYFVSNECVGCRSTEKIATTPGKTRFSG